MRAFRARSNKRGFTLIEVLFATLLMTVILGALATVTAQWLPNWNRGMAKVQRAERLATGVERIAADLSAAEFTTLNADAKTPVFDGSELSVTFVRTAIGPNTKPGLEIVRLIERADAQGLALVRERTPFTPMESDAQVRFADPVVLVRAPFRVTFAYAGTDQIWQPTWKNAGLLPNMIRMSVRDAASGQVLAVSSAVVVHVNAPAECARAKSARQCLTAKLQGDTAKSEGGSL